MVLICGNFKQKRLVPIRGEGKREEEEEKEEEARGYGGCFTKATSMMSPIHTPSCSLKNKKRLESALRIGRFIVDSTHPRNS